MTKERFSFTFDPRDMLLSLQIGFSFVRVAVACAILERIPGPSPEKKCFEVLEACNGTRLLPFHIDLSLEYKATDILKTVSQNTEC